MHHITIRLEDDRFDDMLADEVPALLFALIEHRLWSLVDPRVHVSEIAIAVPPEPVQPVVVELADVEAEVEELQQIIRLETAMVKAKAAA